MFVTTPKRKAEDENSEEIGGKSKKSKKNVKTSRWHGLGRAKGFIEFLIYTHTLLTSK